jgi:acetamidase/formamidase
MRTSRRLWFLLPALLPTLLYAQSPDLNGDWLVTRDFWGSSLHQRLTLKLAEGKLTGDFAGDKLEGTVAGSKIHFIAKDERGNTEELTGSISGETLTGEIVSKPTDEERPETHPFTARRAPQPHGGPPQRHEFVPTKFERLFSAATPPVLTISPGDTVHTTTVDAGGTDEKGVTRVLGGNPETGPFYIAGAMPGDLLVVHLNRIRLNRDWAISDDAIVPRGLTAQSAVRMKDGGKSVRWHLDRERGLATLEKAPEGLKSFSVPVRPMLGCVATAPGFGQPGFATGDSGRYGGNMDFNEIIEGATVYLPVTQPGALLYVGDGHALQGDGELNGNALETSMEVEFTVELLPKQSVPAPRVENATHIMTMGLGGSLDDAFRNATANLGQWLDQQYKLTPSEIAMVVGTSVEYKISEVADRNAGVVAKLRKDRLTSLPKK